MAAPPGKSIVKSGLRFPEFIGHQFRELRLGDVTAESPIRNGDGPSGMKVMGVSKADGIVPMEEHIIASDIGRYKVVRKDWFAYNPMRLNIGSIARWQGDVSVLVSPDYVVFRCLDDHALGMDPGYLDQFRQSMSWKAFVNGGGEGGVRLRIYYDDLAHLRLKLPETTEQRKIAEVLTSLDGVITSQSRKIAALETYKRGLLQELFPREGETTPRLRFPEFRGAADWYECKVGDLIDTVMAPKKIPATSYAKSGAYAIVDQSSNAYCGWTDDTEALVDVNDPLIVFGDHTCTVKLIRAPFAQGADGIKILEPRPNVLGEFLFQALQLRPLVSREYKRHFSELRQKSVSVPLRETGEQERVSATLGALDEKLRAEAKKLAALKVHKNGLMQLLFPVPEEV